MHKPKLSVWKWRHFLKNTKRQETAGWPDIILAGWAFGAACYFYELFLHTGSVKLPVIVGVVLLSGCAALLLTENFKKRWTCLTIPQTTLPFSSLGINLLHKNLSGAVYACAAANKAMANPVAQNETKLPRVGQSVKPHSESCKSSAPPQKNSSNEFSVLDDLAKKAARTVKAQACAIYILGRKGHKLYPYATWVSPESSIDFPTHIIGQNIVGEAAQYFNQTVLRVDNLQGNYRSGLQTSESQYNAALAVPLLLETSTQPVGVLLVVNKIKASPFVVSDEQALVDFVSRQHIALLVYNMKLREEQAQHIIELNIINQMAQSFANPSSLKGVKSACGAVLDQPFLKALFAFDVAEICLWDDETQILTLALNLPEQASGSNADTRYHLGEGYTGWIAANQQTLLIKDIAAYTDVTPKVGIEKFEYGSFLGAPLKVGSHFLGTLELLALATHAFAERDVTLLEIVASQMAVVLENARLFNQTNQQLQRRVDELAGLQRVSTELNSTLDMNKILSMVLEEALQLTQADFGDVYFYNDISGKLVAYQEQHRQNETWLKRPTSQNQIRAISADEGIIGRALRTGESILIANVYTDADFVKMGSNCRSKVVVPIYYAGESIGVINLESEQLNFFNHNQLRYLESLANHAAVAIGNAQAYQQQIVEREQASRRAGQLSRLSEISNSFRTSHRLADVLEDIAFAIAEAVGYDVVLISLVKDTPPKLVPEVGAGIPLITLKQLKEPAQAKPLKNLQSVMLEEFRAGQSYLIPAKKMAVWEDKLNVPYIQKYQPAAHLQLHPKLPALTRVTYEKKIWESGDLLLVPLVDAADNIIGLLTVANPVDDYRPDAESIRTLETFANHAAAAIENAQLFEREKQRRRLADTLRGVAEAISSQLEFDDLLNIILQELSRVIDYGRVNVQLLQEDKLVIVGGHGRQDKQLAVGTSFLMSDDNPNRLVIETQEPVIISNTEKEYAAFFANALHSTTRSWLGVPLTYGTNIFGLMVLDKDETDFFTEEDVKVIVAFANQVAVALQNSRLFNEARQQVKQLAALTDVAQSLNQALDLNEVLNLVLDAVFDLVGHKHGSIWLIDYGTNTVKMANTKSIPDFLVELFNESEISVKSEPFASVIKSEEVLVIQGTAPKDHVTDFGMPFPGDVTYVPLTTEDGVIGIFAIEAVIHNRNELKLVTTLGNLAAVAIESTRLLEDTRRRATEMQNLYSLGVEISQVLEVRQVMCSVVSSTLTLTDSQLGAIMFIDDQTNKQIIENVAANPELAIKFGVDTVNLSDAKNVKDNIKLLWSRLIREVTTTKQPVVVSLSVNKTGKTVPNAHKFTITQDVDYVTGLLSGLGLRSVLGVPVYVQNQVNGAMFVASLSTRQFRERDVQLLSFVANQASVAVRNAQLVQRLNQLTEELEQRVTLRTEELAQTLQDLTEERDRVSTLYEIASELSSSFDLDRVLNEALNLINRAIGISQGSILLVDRETSQLIYRAALGRNKPLPHGGLKPPYKMGYGLAGKVIESREPRLIPDLRDEPAWVPSTSNIDERRSALAVPLITGDDVLGVLLLFYPDPDYFSQDQLKLVTAAGVQIATAVNNAELYRLLTDQAQRLGTLFRKQSSEAAKNQAILESITDGVLVLDGNRDVVLVNPKAAEILNINAGEVVNQPLRQILGRSKSPVELKVTQLLYDNLLNTLTELSAGTRASHFRIESDTKVVTVAVAPVSLGTEETSSVVAVLRDISQEAEIERLKNEFISTVSHELRTPMTSIKGYSDLLLSGNARIGQLNETQHRFVKVIQSNANRLTELVNDILEISRIETGRIKLDFAPLNIIDIIKEVGVSFEGQLVTKSVNLSFQLPPKIPHIYADKARLTQVLVNLIGNAWQYTPEGGNINVSAKVSGNFVQVDVADTGIGIVEKDIAYIFDRFFRSERTEVQVVDGTGLGLSITKSFVEMLGGQIFVQSQIDVGTTFSFTVPLTTHPNDSAPDLLVPPARKQILIIDNDETIFNFLKPGLAEHGYLAVTHSNIQEALNFAQSATKPLQAIVVNASLQVINGFALLEQLKDNDATKNIPVLLSSFSVDAAGVSLQIVDSITPSSKIQTVLTIAKQVLEISAPEKLFAHHRLDSRMPARRILVIEKNRETSSRLKDAFVESGYSVQCAFNSRQGLDMVSGNRPELVFLNTTMPNMRGESVVFRLHNNIDTKNIPVVLITNEPTFSEDIGVKIWGQTSWVKKRCPVTADDLISEMANLQPQTEKQ